MEAHGGHCAQFPGVRLPVCFEICGGEDGPETRSDHAWKQYRHDGIGEKFEIHRFAELFPHGPVCVTQGFRFAAGNQKGVFPPLI